MVGGEECGECPLAQSMKLRYPWQPYQRHHLGAGKLSYSELVKPSRTTNKSCVPPSCRPSRKHLPSSPKRPCFFFLAQHVETKTTTKRILSHSGVVPRLKKLLETPSFDWHQIHAKGNQRNPFSFNVSILKSFLFPVMKGIPNLKSLPNWTQFDIFDKSFSGEKWSWFILIQFFKSTYMCHTWVAILGLGSQPGETDISIQIGIKRVNSSNFVFIKLLNLRRIWPLFSRR